MVNESNLDSSQNSSLITWSNRELAWIFTKVRGPMTSTEIHGRMFFVAVSMRNPAFSNRWLTEVLSCVRHWQGHITVTLADIPYLATIDVLPTVDRRLSAIEAYEMQRSEQLRRINRLIASNSDVGRFVSWGTLQSFVPSHFLSEIENAFHRKGRVYDLVIQQVKTVFNDISDLLVLERLAQFLIREIPTLLYVYYDLLKGCVDVYPAKQAEIFWCIDRGELAEELPTIQAFVLQSTAHTYALVTRHDLATRHAKDLS